MQCTHAPSRAWRISMKGENVGEIFSDYFQKKRHFNHGGIRF
jgi:hypothetical protein